MQKLAKVQFKKFLQVPSAGSGESLKSGEKVQIVYDSEDRMVSITAIGMNGVVSRRFVPLENVVMMELEEDFKVAEDQRNEIVRKEEGGRKSEKAGTKGSKGNTGMDSEAKGTGRRGRPKAKG